jgi:hypothetical protein
MPHQMTELRGAFTKGPILKCGSNHSGSLQGYSLRLIVFNRGVIRRVTMTVPGAHLKTVAS